MAKFLWNWLLMEKKVVFLDKSEKAGKNSKNHCFIIASHFFPCVVWSLLLSLQISVKILISLRQCDGLNCFLKTQVNLAKLVLNET